MSVQVSFLFGRQFDACDPVLITGFYLVVLTTSDRQRKAIAGQGETVLVISFFCFVPSSITTTPSPPPLLFSRFYCVITGFFLLDNKADLTQIGRREYVALILSFVLPIFPKGTVIISTVYVAVKSESNRVIKPKKRKGSSREKRKKAWRCSVSMKTSW